MKIIKICPRCGSDDVVPDLSPTMYARGAIFNSYKCNNCGYSGEFFIEIEKEEIKKFKS